MSNQQNSTDWLVAFLKTKESSINEEANFTQFGKQKYYWIDNQGQKHEKVLYCMHEGGKYMEANVVQLRLFKAICDDAEWHGPQRFRNFVDLLGGALAEDWEDLMNDGDDNWDPADTNDDDDFNAAIKAFLIKVTGEPMPGNLQHQRIMETKYSSCKTDKQWTKPSFYWRRKATMWKHAEVYGRVGAAIENQAVLEAEFHGLPLSAREWLKDDATGDGVDIFDGANNGTEMYTPRDLFTLLDKWWRKEVIGTKNGGNRNNTYTEEEDEEEEVNNQDCNRNNSYSEEENEPEEEERHNCSEEEGEQYNSAEEENDYSNAEEENNLSNEEEENYYSNEEEENNLSNEEEEENYSNEEESNLSNEEEEEEENNHSNEEEVIEVISSEEGADDKNYSRRKRARYSANTKGPGQYYGSHYQHRYHQQSYQQQDQGYYYQHQQPYQQQDQGSYHYHQQPYQQQVSYYQHQQPCQQQVSYHQEPYTQPASSVSASNYLSSSGSGNITKTVVWNPHSQQWE